MTGQVWLCTNNIGTQQYQQKDEKTGRYRRFYQAVCVQFRGSLDSNTDQHVNESHSEPQREIETRRWSVAGPLHPLRHHCRGCSPSRARSTSVKQCDLVNKPECRERRHLQHQAGMPRLSDLSTASELLGNRHLRKTQHRTNSSCHTRAKLQPRFNSLDSQQPTIRSSATSSQLEPPTSCGGGFTVRSTTAD